MNIYLKSEEHLRLLSITEDLIRLDSNSLSGNEETTGKYILEFFQKLPVMLQEQTCAAGRSNIIVKVKGKDSSRCIMYSGHMDTVPAGDPSSWTFHPLQPEIREEKLYGRGSCDMKGSLACSMFAIEYMCIHKIVPENDLLLVYDVDEENTNLGLKSYLKNPLPADFILVGEPTELKLNTGHRGVMAFTVTIHGKSAHAGQPEHGKNAIYAAWEIISSVKTLQKQLEKKYQEYAGSPSITVTQISGGEKVNVIPDLVILRIDRRLVFGETCSSCTKELEQILKDAEEKTGCFWELKITTFCPPGHCESDLPAVKKVGTILNSMNLPSTPEGFPASCEAGLLQETLHVPAIILGPGSISQAHQSDEYISLSQLYLGAELYIRLFSLLKLEGRNNHV